MAYAAFADRPGRRGRRRGRAWAEVLGRDQRRRRRGRGRVPDRGRPRRTWGHAGRHRAGEGRHHQARSVVAAGPAVPGGRRGAARARRRGSGRRSPGRAWSARRRARVPAVGGQVVSPCRAPCARYDDVFRRSTVLHQAQNAAVALAAVEAFVGGDARRRGRARAAFAEVTSPGVWRSCAAARPWCSMRGNNPHGAAATAAALEDRSAFALIGVVGVMTDKDHEGLLTAFEPHPAHVVCTQNSTDRPCLPSGWRRRHARLARTGSRWRRGWPTRSTRRPRLAEAGRRPAIRSAPARCW